METSARCLFPALRDRLDPSIYEAIQKEGVAVGDVVYIEANSGAVKRVGRSDAYATVSVNAPQNSQIVTLSGRSRAVHQHGER